MPEPSISPLPQSVLPAGIRSRFVEGVNDLAMHVLEAGSPEGSAGTILLLHGFPELAYCWRRLMPLLAMRGFHVVAPDQRGYGRTTPAPVAFDDPVWPYSLHHLASDIVALVGLLGVSHVAAVVGHDFGSLVAGASALARPDLFHRLAMLGTPFPGAPGLQSPRGGAPADDPIHAALRALPSPRRHYLQYYAGREANHDMWRSAQGVGALLRGYYHHKSADWSGNRPHPLDGWTAEQLARMPSYYVMPADRSMAQIAAAHAPSAAVAAACEWLTAQELGFIADEFERTGFQGGLHWYRSAMRGEMARDLAVLAGVRLPRPTTFIAGEGDWAAYQAPGALETMIQHLAHRPTPATFIRGAGHWLQQERPEALAEALAAFLEEPVEDLQGSPVQ